jgi:DNA-binding phage protein
MPLTRNFKDTILENMRRKPGFAKAMFLDGINCFLQDEFDVGKDVLRDYINGTIGFEKLGKKVGLPPKSLMRMFGRNGNPQAKNFFAVIAALQKYAGIKLHVVAAE